MTTTPTPARARSRELATELIMNRMSGTVMDSGWYKDFVNEVTAALIEMRREALTEAAQAVRDAGGDNEDYHVSAIERLKETP